MTGYLIVSGGVCIWKLFNNGASTIFRPKNSCDGPVVIFNATFNNLDDIKKAKETEFVSPH